MNNPNKPLILYNSFPLINNVNHVGNVPYSSAENLLSIEQNQNSGVSVSTSQRGGRIITLSGSVFFKSATQLEKYQKTNELAEHIKSVFSDRKSFLTIVPHFAYKQITNFKDTNISEFFVFDDAVFPIEKKDNFRLIDSLEVTARIDTNQNKQKQNLWLRNMEGIDITSDINNPENHPVFLMWVLIPNPSVVRKLTLRIGGAGFASLQWILEDNNLKDYQGSQIKKGWNIFALPLFDKNFVNNVFDSYELVPEQQGAGSVDYTNFGSSVRIIVDTVNNKTETQRFGFGGCYMIYDKYARNYSCYPQGEVSFNQTNSVLDGFKNDFSVTLLNHTGYSTATCELTEFRGEFNKNFPNVCDLFLGGNIAQQPNIFIDLNSFRYRNAMIQNMDGEGLRVENTISGVSVADSTLSVINSEVRLKNRNVVFEGTVPSFQPNFDALVFNTVLNGQATIELGQIASGSSVTYRVLAPINLLADNPLQLSRFGEQEFQITSDATLTRVALKRGSFLIASGTEEINYKGVNLYMEIRKKEIRDFVEVDVLYYREKKFFSADVPADEFFDFYPTKDLKADSDYPYRFRFYPEPAKIFGKSLAERYASTITIKSWGSSLSATRNAIFGSFDPSYTPMQFENYEMEYDLLFNATNIRNEIIVKNKTRYE